MRIFVHIKQDFGAMRRIQETLFEQAGKFTLDIAKLVFGGIIIVGIMQREDIANLKKLYIFATLAVVTLIITGFMFYYYSKRKE